jgi:transcriptional regulator with XRE-family HTH domain
MKLEETGTRRSPTAEESIQRLRKSLGADNPAFEASELVESDAELLCGKIRKDLRERRKAMRVDQATMAAKMNLSQSAISKIENGRGDIGIKALFRYSDALGLRPLVLFVASPLASVKENDRLASKEAVEEANSIVSAQDMFLRKMSEMVPSLTAVKAR